MVDKLGLTDVKIENAPKKKIFGDWIHKGVLVLYKGRCVYDCCAAHRWS